jgi:hypothetical protein
MDGAAEDYLVVLPRHWTYNIEEKPQHNSVRLSDNSADNQKRCLWNIDPEFCANTISIAAVKCGFRHRTKYF